MNALAIRAIIHDRIKTVIGSVNDSLEISEHVMNEFHLGETNIVVTVFDVTENPHTFIFRF